MLDRCRSYDRGRLDVATCQCRSRWEVRAGPVVTFYLPVVVRVDGDGGIASFVRTSGAGLRRTQCEKRRHVRHAAFDPTGRNRIATHPPLEMSSARIGPHLDRAVSFTVRILCRRRRIIWIMLYLEYGGRWGETAPDVERTL